MLESVDGKQKAAIIKELKSLNKEAQTRSFFNHSRSKNQYPYDEDYNVFDRKADEQFKAIDNILNTIFVPVALASVYREAVMQITMENDGGIALKPLIYRLKTYQETGR